MSNMKLIFESWRRFLSENIDSNVEELITGATGEDIPVRKAYSYCSVILDTASQSALIAATEEFLNTYEDRRVESLTINPPGKKLCHHMTFKMGDGNESKLKEPLKYEHGQRVEIQINQAKLQISDNGHGILAGIADGGLTNEPGDAHVTLALNVISPGKAGTIDAPMIPFPSVSLTGYANVPFQLKQKENSSL